MNQNNSYYSRKGPELKLTGAPSQKVLLHFHLKQYNMRDQSISTVHAAAVLKRVISTKYKNTIQKVLQFVSAVNYLILYQLENYAESTSQSKYLLPSL